jgi:hypothetical protein
VYHQAERYHPQTSSTGLFFSLSITQVKPPVQACSSRYQAPKSNLQYRAFLLLIKHPSQTVSVSILNGNHSPSLKNHYGFVKIRKEATDSGMGTIVQHTRMSFHIVV